MKKKRKLRRGLFAKLLAPWLVIFAILLSFQIYKLNILPVHYLIPVVVILVVLALLFLLLAYFKTRKSGMRIFVTFMVFVLTVAYGAANYYVYKTDEMFARIDDLADKIVNTETIRVMKGSAIQDMKDLNNVTVGICTAQDKDGVQLMETAITNAGVKIKTQDYPSMVDMTAALYDGEIQAMIMNDGFLGVVHDVEPYTFVTTETRVVYQEIFYTPRPTVKEDSKDQVNVTQDPFTVLISGNDTYGSLGENSRSDVNMLVTVNPKTGIVLMTSIPRDYYLEMDCPDGFGCAQGEMDKLTHTGLHGVETTEATLEKALDININYTVRVNFSSLVNLVDALDGVDVQVDKGLAVETFYANETLEGVKEGMNHLDGERALAFARERHAYLDGDNQRVRNQQIVLRAIIDKITSPTILLNYGKFVDAIGGAFETDMPSSQIKDLMRYQLTMNPHWQFESYALRGEGSTEYCAELGTAAYVTIPDEYSLQIAREKLQAVLKGESANEIEDTGESAPAGSIEQPQEDEADDNYDYSFSQEENEQNISTPSEDEDLYSSYSYDQSYDTHQYDEDLSSSDEEDPYPAESEFYNQNWTMAND